MERDDSTMPVRTIPAASMKQVGTEEQAVARREFHRDGLLVVSSIALDVLCGERTKIDPLLKEMFLDLESV
jgi:hypothetical protein